MTRPSAHRCYLDYNASAPLRPAVREAMLAALDLTGNPSSIHGHGRACRSVIEAARRAVAVLAGARPAQVVFTSGGTEANALALSGGALSGGALSGLAVAATVVSAIEHESVQAAAPDALRLPVDRHGVADLAALEALLARLPGPVLVSLMLVNNETGVIQPVAEAAALVHRHGGLLHCDAVQAAGRLPVERGRLGADLLSLSAHKLGGPAGIGALVLDEALTLRPLLRGGGQERGRRAGTENLAGIAGFGRAAGLAGDDLTETPPLARWRDRLERAVQALMPDVVVFGAGAARVAGTSCLALPGVAAETQVMALDLAGVAVSAGAACSSGKLRRSAVLTAMGAGPELAGSAIRVSLGWASREDDVDCFIAAWGEMAARLRRPPLPCMTPPEAAVPGVVQP